MKANLSATIFFLLAVGLMLYILVRTSDAYNELNKKYDSKVGDTHVFKGDTLRIINYSMWDETFTLDNGVIIKDILVFEQP